MEAPARPHRRCLQSIGPELLPLLRVILLTNRFRLSPSFSVDATPNRMGGDDPKSPHSPAPVILVTYATTEDAVHKALREIKNRGVIAGRPQVIRIEKN